jgi:glutathione synthase
MLIGFLIAAWEEIEPQKSATLAMIHECMLRDHEVCILNTSNLTVRNNQVYGFVRILSFEGKIPDQPHNLYKKIKFSEKMVPLNLLDAFFVRKDPPIDPLVLNFLDSIKDETLVLNDINGLREANNKLYTTTFHDPDNEFLPVTHVSKNKEYLLRMIDEGESEKMILKPLDGSGGRGVIVLEKSARSNINSLLDFYIDDGKNYVILQNYIPGGEEGDVRVLMLNGKVLGAYQRKPAEGEFRANIQAGGSAHKYDLSTEQLKMLKRIGPKLVKDGLYFVGLDLIGTKLLEVNVCNPGGITNINKLNRKKLQRDIVDFIEDMVEQRAESSNALHYRLTRRLQLKNNT